tara:strand:+ start:273 stop:605 length:333 start_codon:yes stop_codon:yes gene_type:complete
MSKLFVVKVIRTRTETVSLYLPVYAKSREEAKKYLSSTKDWHKDTDFDHNPYVRKKVKKFEVVSIVPAGKLRRGRGDEDCLVNFDANPGCFCVEEWVYGGAVGLTLKKLL